MRLTLGRSSGFEAASSSVASGLSFRLALGFVLAAFLLAACRAAGSSTTATNAPDASQGEFVFGEPADPTDADRIVEIAATDALIFDPADLRVRVGETITFRIANDGTIIHDFTLGDEATQNEHEEDMAEMGGMAHDEPNAATVAAGKTKELTWTFTHLGTVLIGCHQPGHYEAGMKGQIAVEA